MPKPKKIIKERRASRRVSASKVIPEGVVRLNTGQEVELVNIGLNGTILVRTRIMLPPGAYVRLRLRMPKNVFSLDGRIERSRVVGLKQTKIMYEAAVTLDGGLPTALAEIVRQTEEQQSPGVQSASKSANPGAARLSEASQIWVLDSQTTGAENR
jgi:hypothetical protein